VMFMDDRLRDLDPRPHLPASVEMAREAIARATAELLTITDTALERPWDWVGGGGESDVRSGCYIALEELERATGALVGLASGPEGERRPAAWAIAATTTARWELHGVLAAIDDADLDADPGGGEWTVRQTLAHTLATERGYAWFTGWWAGRDPTVELPPHAPETLEQDLPGDDANAGGSLRAIRRRLDALVDLSAELYRDATDDVLAGRARWSGFPVTVGFRVGRTGPHIEEHTIQVEKTLALLGRQPTEVARLVRLILRAMGRMEAAVSVLPRSMEGTAADVIGPATSEVARIAVEIAEAARR
jgi:DinB superfamily